MKNSNLFLLVAALFVLVSCGTVTHTSLYGTSQLRNSIYYSSNSGPVQAVVQDYIEKPVALAEGESYESRLTKFDSPVYNVNIIVEDPYPWWGYRWHNPFYPSWRWGYSWYSPWYSPWYTSWYDAYYWDWHWYHPHYYYPLHRPVHHPIFHPGPGAVKPGKPVYYGKRGSSPSYRDTGRGHVSAGHGSPMGRPSQGSVTRRTQTGRPVVKGDNQSNARPQSVQHNNGQQNQQYRRTSERSSSSFSNSSSGSNRGSYMNNGGGGQRSGGGSQGSYRRR